MERQLKERLIGAAVLVAAAVVMVPEMFSGQRPHAASVIDTDAASAGQVKTYRIELQSASRTMETAPVAVDEPAERPQSEASEAVRASSNSAESTAEASSSAAMSSQPVQMASIDMSPAMSTASVKPVAAKPEHAKPADEAAAKDKSTLPKNTESPAQPLADGWAVQVGSFAAENKAQHIAKTLKEQGYVAYVGPVKVGSKTLYRVRVGATAERVNADATLRKLKSAYPGASVVAANR